MNKKKSGIISGVVGSVFWGLDPHICTVILLMVPFVDGDMKFKLGLVGAAGMVGFFKELASLLCLTGAQAVKRDLLNTLNTIKQPKERKAWFWIAMSALVSGPIATATYAMAVNMAGPAWPAMITAIYPVLTALLAAIILKDKLSGKGWLGVAVVGVAVVLLSLVKPESDAYSMLTVGILLACVTAFAWGFEGVFLSIGLRNSKLSSFQCLFIRGLFALAYWIVIVIPFIARPDGWSFIGSVFTHPMVLFLMLLYGANLVGNLTFYYRAIDYIGPGRAANINTLYVIFNVILGFIISTIFASYTFEAPSWSFYVAAALIVFGNVLVNSDSDEASSLPDKVV